MVGFDRTATVTACLAGNRSTWASSRQAFTCHSHSRTRNATLTDAKRKTLFGIRPHETQWADDLTGSPLAPFGRRAGAFVVDLAAAFVTSVPLTLLRNAVWPTGERYAVTLDVHQLWGLAWVIVYFGSATWLWNGRTPGKRLFRIRVASVVAQT